MTASVNHAALRLIKVLLYRQSERGENAEDHPSAQIMHESSKNRSPGRMTGLCTDSEEHVFHEGECFRRLPRQTDAAAEKSERRGI